MFIKGFLILLAANAVLGADDSYCVTAMAGHNVMDDYSIDLPVQYIDAKNSFTYRIHSPECEITGVIAKACALRTPSPEIVLDIDPKFSYVKHGWEHGCLANDPVPVKLQVTLTCLSLPEPEK